MTTSSEGSFEKRIEQAIVRALKVPNATSPLRMGSTPGWDSMGHMLVVVELEKGFGTRFPPFVLPQLVDVPSIVKVLQKPA